MKPFDELLRHGIRYVTTTVHDAQATDTWTVYAVRGSDDTRLWQADVPLSVAPLQSLAVLLAASDDAAYVVGQGDHFVTARQASDGAVQWTYTSTDAVLTAFLP